MLLQIIINFQNLFKMEKAPAKVLTPLRMASLYFNLFHDSPFSIVAQDVKSQEIEKRDEKGRFASFSLFEMFLGEELKFEEIRDIYFQIYTCNIPNYPVDKLLNLINKDWDKTCWTQLQIKAFMKKRGKYILGALESEFENQTSSLTFLGKNEGRYLLIFAELKDGNINEIEYDCSELENSTLQLRNFFVTPIDYPTECIYEK